MPNAAAAAGVIGARPVEVPMGLGNAGWSLDLDRLERAAGPRTRALFLVSPSNPTGWTATREELNALLALARCRGLWIIADETYGRFRQGHLRRIGAPRKPRKLRRIAMDIRVAIARACRNLEIDVGRRMRCLGVGETRLHQHAGSSCAEHEFATRNHDIPCLKDWHWWLRPCPLTKIRHALLVPFDKAISCEIKSSSEV